MREVPTDEPLHLVRAGPELREPESVGEVHQRAEDTDGVGRRGTAPVKVSFGRPRQVPANQGLTSVHFSGLKNTNLLLFSPSFGDMIVNVHMKFIKYCKNHPRCNFTLR